MLNARGTKLLNPLRFLRNNAADIIRDLFLEAEEEHGKQGEKSGLYVVVFDQLDVILNCGGNNVANLLLSKVWQAEPPLNSTKLTTSLRYRWTTSTH